MLFRVFVFVGFFVLSMAPKSSVLQPPPLFHLGIAESWMHRQSIVCPLSDSLINKFKSILKSDSLDVIFKHAFSITQHKHTAHRQLGFSSNQISPMVSSSSSCSW